MPSVHQTTGARLGCSRSGAVVEWLGSGLQSRVHRFDSGRRLWFEPRIPLWDAGLGSYFGQRMRFVDPGCWHESVRSGALPLRICRVVTLEMKPGFETVI